MSSIKHDLIHGVFWSAVGRYSAVTISIVISMILARLLTPADYGVVSISVVLISFLQMFSTLGIGPAIIQRKDLNRKDLNSLFTFSLILGTVLALLFFGCSWLIARFYGNSLLVPICQIMSILIFFSSANMVPGALMSRDKRFKILAIRSLILQILTGAVAITAAYHGAGPYALLISPIITSLGIFIWNRHYYKVSVDLHFSIEPIRRIFSFSSYQFLFEFVNYFSRNLDKLIIGKFMNLAALGVYDIAYKLMSYPMMNITGVISPVIQPVLKDLQEDKPELSRKHAKIIKFIATISFPVGIICCFLSKEIIQVFCGDKWDAAIPIFSILALSLPFQMILSTSGSIFSVCYNTRLMFWTGIRNTATTVAGFLIAAFVFKTIEAMAWAWTITLIINFICTYWIMYKYALNAPIHSMLTELRHPCIIAGALAVLFYFLNNTHFGDAPLIPLIIKTAISLIVTLLLIQLTGQYNLIAMIRAKLHKRGTSEKQQQDSLA